MELRVQILPCFEAKSVRGWGELLLMLEILQDNNNMGNRLQMRESPGKYGRFDINGGPLIIATASSILDVGKGSGSAWDIFCMKYRGLFE